MSADLRYAGALKARASRGVSVLRWMIFGSLLAIANVAVSGTSTTVLTAGTNPAVVAQSVMLTATVTGSAPTGIVTFKDGASILGTGTVSAGVATYAASFNTAASHSLTAVYGGDSNNTGSTSTALNETVNKRTTTTVLTASPSPANVAQSVTLTATVTGTAAGGNVTFKDGAATLGTGVVSSGVATFTTTFSTAVAHSLTAIYAGDANNLTSTSAVFSLTVNKRATTTVVTASPNPGTVAQAVTLTATVTGTAATGSVTFKDGAATLGTGTVSAGVATLATTFSTAVAHNITAVYAGDTNNLTSTSAVLNLTVNKRTTTTVLAASPNPAKVAQSVTLTATLTGTTVSGTVTFLDGATTIGTGAVSAGKATLVTTFSSAAVHSLTAVYGGDANNLTSTSAAVSETVNLNTSTTVLTSGTNPAKVGQSVTLTATITATAPTGTVTFKDAGATIGTATVSAGKATFAATFASAGAHSLTATYAGDSQNAASTSSALTETVNLNASTTALASGTNPGSVGQNVLLTATITGSSPSGIVTFKDGSTPIGTGAVSAGHATLTATFATAATHSLTAVYGGDAANATSTSTVVNEVVNKNVSAAVLTVGPNPANIGQSVTMSATVTGSAPSGNVSFREGATVLGTVPLTTGSATFTFAFGTAGTHYLNVNYVGDAANQASTSATVQLQVNVSSTSTTLATNINPVASAAPVTLTATVTGSGPTGYVNFLDGGVSIAQVPMVGSVATLNWGSVVGVHSVTAVYQGDSNNATSTSNVVSETVTLSPTAVRLTASPGTAGPGQQITLTATLSGGAINGNADYVTFKDGGTTLGGSFGAGGVMTLTTNLSAIGVHSLTAVYAGDSQNAASVSTPVAETVNLASTTTTLTTNANPIPAYGYAGLTAAVAGINPTGIVTFKDGSAVLGAASVNSGVAVVSVPFAAAGSHSLTASFAGDASNQPSTSAVVIETVNINSSSIAMSSATNPIPAGQAVSLTATVTAPVPSSGTVTFMDGPTVIATSGSASTVNVAVVFSTSGSHSLTAVYSGDPGTSGSTSGPVVENVTVGTSHVSLSQPSSTPAGQALTLQAIVSGSNPTGTVTFLDGATTLGTAPLNGGIASSAVVLTTVGMHSLVASYGGDANNASASSTAVNETVTIGTSSVALGTSPNPATVGQNVTLSATVTGANPSGVVTFKDSATTLGTATISAGVASRIFTFSAPGIHSLTVSYAGDANNSSSTSAAALESVGGAGTSATTLTSGQNPVTTAQSVTLTANVTGTSPTGTVTFKDGAASLGTGTLSAGVATLATTFAATGVHTLTASYGGDGSNVANVSASVSQTVLAASTVTLVSSINPSGSGQPTTLTATVSGSSPTGTVTFKDNATTLGTAPVSGGVAVLAAGFASTGIHSLTAVYSGDAANGASTSANVSQTVFAQANTSTTLTSSTNPSTANQSTTLTASVIGSNPTGAVTFYDIAAAIGTAAVNGGQAVLTTSSLSIGTHNLHATYSADAANQPSTSGVVSQVVNGLSSSITVTSSANPGQLGMDTTLTATVTGTTPTGLVGFSYDGTNLPPVGLASGKASASIYLSSLGSHTVVASYGGDTLNAASTSAPLTQTIGQAATTVILNGSPNPALSTDPITLTASVAGPTLATGTLTFKDGTTVIGTAQMTPQTGPVGSITTTFAVGLHNITAVYSGDTNNLAATSQVFVADVRQSATTLSLTTNGNPTAVGQSVVLTATLTGGLSPDGIGVLFKDGDVNLGTVSLSGRVATLITVFTTPGTHTLTAAFPGNSQNGSSTSAAVAQGVGVSTTSVTSNANPSTLAQSVTFSATVVGASPTGSIAFSDGGLALATVPLSGTNASYTTALAARGSHTITATYSGDANNVTSSGTFTQKVWSSDVALATSSNPVVTGQPLALTATVTGTAPAGTVTFMDGATVLAASQLSSGSATISTSLAVVGVHSVTAVYSGDAANAPATSDVLPQQVTSGTGGVASGPMTWGYQYDALGNMTSVMDPNGNATTKSYDALSRVATITQPPPAAGLQSPVITLGYDGQDRTALVKDPRNLSTTYGLDGLGNVGTLTSPDSGVTNSTFDAAGNVLTRTDARGKTTTYSYDALSRLISASYTSGVATTFEYDGGSTPTPAALGHLTKITDESGSTTFAYDSLGNVLSKVQTVGIRVLTTSYGWGVSGPSNGKLTSITYPSNARVNYSYDAAGRVQALTVNPPNANDVGTNTGSYLTILSGITYNAESNILGWTWANGAPYARTYDTFGRLKSFPVGYFYGTGISAGLIRTLSYDNAGRITNYDHSNVVGVQPAFGQGFNYDGLDRLTQQTTASLSYGYSYDATGNRIVLTLGANTYVNTVSATSNRLTVVQTAGTGGTAVNNNQTYTNAGGVTSDGTATYLYSDRGRMASSTAGGSTTTYKYNGLEQRVIKAGTLVPTGAAYYAYDESGKTTGEYDANLYPVAETVYIGTMPVAVITETGTAAASSLQITVGNIYADQVDTPRVITRNSDEAILWRWDGAEAFGNSPALENPSGFGNFSYNQRMPGQIFDAEDQNFYNWNRDYRPQIGRYVQSDPIGLSAGINTYDYGLNQPSRYSDPSGLLPPAAAGLCLIPGVGWVGCATVVGGAVIVGGLWWMATTRPSANDGTSSNVYPFPSRSDTGAGWCPPAPPTPCEQERLRLENNKTSTTSLLLISNPLRAMQQYNVAATLLNKEIDIHNSLCPGYIVEPLPLKPIGPRPL